MALQSLKDVKPPDAALVVPAGQPCRMALDVALYTGEAGRYELIAVGLNTVSSPDTTPGQKKPKGTVLEHSSMDLGSVYDPPSGNS